MTDLRELVARAIGAGLPYHGETPDDMRQRALAKADAVLSAIGERHAIVERVGDDVIERVTFIIGDAIVRYTEPETIAQHIAPIIAANARDAALEEAAKWLKWRALEFGGDNPSVTAMTMRGITNDLADEMTRALKSGGHAHD